MHNRFDQLVKRLARKGLSAGGRVETDAEVSPDAHRIDIWFMPDSARAPAALAPLGLFGRMGRTACTIESFHRTPVASLVADCIARHRFFCRELARRKPRPPEPIQWVICAGKPSAAMNGLGFRRSGRGRGIYDTAPLWRTKLVVVSDLPRTRDTLLIRLMGAGETLVRAMAEIRALPTDAPERRLALRVLVQLRIEIPADPAKQTKSDREFLMASQEVDKYLADLEEKGHERGRKRGLKEGLKEGRQVGRQEGRQEGREEAAATILLELLATKLGPVPAKVRTRVSSASFEQLTSWTKRVLTATSFDDVVGALPRSSRPLRPSAKKAARPSK